MPRPLRNATTRRVDQFGKLEDFIAGVNGAAADEDHRRLAAGDQRAAALTRFGVGLRCREKIERFATPVSARCVNTSQGISSATGPRRPDSISWNARLTSVGAVVGIFDAVGPFHETSQCGELVRHLVQMAAALAEILRRHLSGQAQHRLFDPYAVSKAAPALSAPGPGTTLNTPGRPVDRA